MTGQCVSRLHHKSIFKTPNAFYSRSSDIKSVSQNYRIPSIEYLNLRSVLDIILDVRCFPPKGKFAVKSVLLNYSELLRYHSTSLLENIKVYQVGSSDIELLVVYI